MLPAVAEPLHWWSARDLAHAIASRELSAVEVMRAHLDRIHEVNPRLNAIVTLLDDDAALAMAQEADRAVAAGGPLGPLHGLPFAVKDLMDTAGMRTTYGSPLYADHVPTTDSLLARRVREAGALVIGKTNTPEWGAGSQTFNPVFGATRNPYDPSLTCGGSSGGARRRARLGDAAPRRRLRPRRQPAQPGRVLQRRRRAPGPGPRAVGRAGRRVQPPPGPGPDGPQRGRRGAAALRPRGPRQRRADGARRRSARLRVASRPRARGPADRLEHDDRRPALRAGGPERARRNPRAARGQRRAGHAARARPRRRGRGLRDVPRARHGPDGCGDRGASRRLQGDGAPQRRAGPGADADRTSRAPRRCAPSCTAGPRPCSPSTTCSRCRSRRSCRSPSSGSSRPRSPARRWTATSSGCAAARGSPPRRSRRCRSPRASRPAGLPVGLQLVGAPRGERALLAIGAAVEELLGAGTRRPSV